MQVFYVVHQSFVVFFTLNWLVHLHTIITNKDLAFLYIDINCISECSLSVY